MAIEPLLPLARLHALRPAEGGRTEPAATASGFGRLLQTVAGQNQQAHAAAEAAVRQLAVGQAQDLHTVALAVARADLSFRLILELRNRLSDAYQEITRMQV